MKTGSAGAKIGGFARDNSNLLLLLIMVALAAVAIDSFFTWDNMMNLFRRISINGVMAVGFTMVLLTGGFDLSIGSTLSLSAVLCIGVEKSMNSSLIGMVVAIGAGAAVGLLNGVLMKVTRGGSGEAFLITLGTSMVASSAALTYTNSYDLYGVNEEWYRQIGQGNLLGFPIAALIWIAIMALFQFLIKKTVFGRRLLLSGANKKSAFLVGVNVGRIKIAAFAIAGMMAAVAAIIMTSRTTAASPRSGSGADFDAAIASIIGGNSLVGGRGGMVQVFIGVVIYGLITNILNLLGIESVVQYIVKGAVLLLAICLDGLKRR